MVKKVNRFFSEGIGCRGGPKVGIIHKLISNKHIFSEFQRAITQYSDNQLAKSFAVMSSLYIILDGNIG